MNRACRLLWVGATATIVAATVSAQPTAFWRENQISDGAVASDPALATMQSWSLMVTNTEGFWASAGMRAVLPPGNTFYKRTAAGNRFDFRPPAGQIAADPALEFVTYVSDPRNQTGANPPAILGPFPEDQPPVSFGSSEDLLPGTFSISWGDPFGRPHAADTYEYARLTFPVGDLPTTHPQSVVYYFLPELMVSIPQIPEPTTLGCVAIALLAMRCRRRAA